MSVPARPAIAVGLVTPIPNDLSATFAGGAADLAKGAGQPPADSDATNLGMAAAFLDPDVTLAPAEHSRYRWVPQAEAAALTISFTNRDAILALGTRRAAAG